MRFIGNKESILEEIDKLIESKKLTKKTSFFSTHLVALLQ